MARNHSELQELLGAYALDALEADEAELLEHHLADCPKCRAELADHRETASMLAHAGAPAPEGLWDRIALSLDDAPADADTVFRMPVGLSGADRKQRRFTGSRWRRAAFAAAAVAAAIIAVDTVVIMQDRGDTSLKERIALAVAAPNSKLVKLTSADKRQSIDAVLTADGRGYILHSNLKSLDKSKTYQLWGIVNGRPPISLGVLGRAPDEAEFAAHLSPDVLAITVERAGGVQASKEMPLLVGSVTS